jgi:hypothetical protein
VPFFPAQVPHRLPWNQTQASVVKTLLFLYQNIGHKIGFPCAIILKINSAEKGSHKESRYTIIIKLQTILNEHFYSRKVGFTNSVTNFKCVKKRD